MRNKSTIVTLVLLLLIGIWVADFLDAAGVFTEPEPRMPGTCTRVSGPIGVEDITIDQQTGIAYFSATDRRALARGEAATGKIYAYDLEADEPQPVDLTPRDGRPLQPHGISLYRSANGARVLFVVNHAEGRHAIEIFDLREGRLEHRRSVRGSALVSPNDVVGVDENRFYVTNDHGHPTGLMRTLEDYLRLRLSSVYYYDGSDFQPALTGIGGANGINVSPDGRTLYLNAASERRLRVYTRDVASGALAERDQLSFDGFPDNVEVMPSGTLLVAVHAKVLALVAHMKDPSALSPSEIVRISTRGGDPEAVETFYVDSGRRISGASVGAMRGDRLLIGAIFEPFVIDCRVYLDTRLGTQ